MTQSDAHCRPAFQDSRPLASSAIVEPAGIGFVTAAVVCLNLE